MAENTSGLENLDNLFTENRDQLEKRLKEIPVDPETYSNLENTEIRKLIKGQILNSFPLGGFINALLKANESLSNGIRNFKKEYLLELYIKKTEDHSRAISNLAQFITNPYGNILFNKILSILDDRPAENALFSSLASALNHMTDGDFESLFSEHKFALSQIEKLTPQSLAILADYQAWPTIHLNGYKWHGTRVISDYFSEFTDSYTIQKGITNEELSQRVHYAISELENSRLLEAHLIGEKVARCEATNIGRTLIKYISA